MQFPRIGQPGLQRKRRGRGNYWHPRRLSRSFPEVAVAHRRGDCGSLHPLLGEVGSIGGLEAYGFTGAEMRPERWFRMPKRNPSVAA